MLEVGQRLDKVNDDIQLIQFTEGLTFGTDALLLAAYINGKHRSALEIGGGTGIISLLVCSRKKAEAVDCVEVQPDFARLIEKNAHLNGMTDKVTAVLSDVRDYRPGKEFELCFSNPPYMKNDSGKSNSCDYKNIARHEENGTIFELCDSAARLVKFGGSFYLVYRPDRLCDLIYALRNSGFEPKRMTMVAADSDSAPSMVLIEAKRGGKCGLKLTRPLLIYNDKNHKIYTDDMDYIMDNGAMPFGFGV